MQVPRLIQWSATGTKFVEQTKVGTLPDRGCRLLVEQLYDEAPRGSVCRRAATDHGQGRRLPSQHPGGEGDSGRPEPPTRILDGQGPSGSGYDRLLLLMRVHCLVGNLRVLPEI